MQEQKINVAFVGHVDHGKSSILGRLLVETHSLPNGKLEQLKTYCESHSKDFEYAYLTDALEKEQSQGITIDTARYFIQAKGRKFLLIDTPGHLDFIKNMITGSSAADAAVLIVDAKEGVKENTLRHIFLLSFLQIRQVIVAVNKMDQIGYSESLFIEHANAIRNIFAAHSLTAKAILPLSAKQGDHFIKASLHMPWYRGPFLWESLCALSPCAEIEGGHFRMPLQDIYRFSKEGDARRIYAGTINSGYLKKGDRLLFSPSQKQGVVASIESEKSELGAAVGFTLESPIFVERGELVSRLEEPSPVISQKLKARLFWIGNEPFSEGAKYTLRIHTSKVECRIEKVLAVCDSATLETRESAEGKIYDIIECIIHTSKPIAFDLFSSCFETSRFVLTGSRGMLGNGIVLANIEAEPIATKMRPEWILVEEEEMLEDAFYSIRLENFEAKKQYYLGMLKVCQDLRIHCRIYGACQQVHAFLNKEFPDVAISVLKDKVPIS